VVLATDVIHVFLLGREFLLRTDHRALRGIFNSKLTNSARITKWLLKLQPYKFVVQVIRGKDNIVADSLSRIPWPIVVKDESAISALTLVGAEDEIAEPLVEEQEIPQEQPVVDLKTIKAAQQNDETLSRLIIALQTDKPPDLENEPNITPNLRTLVQLYDQLELNNEVLVLRDGEIGSQVRIVLPTELIDTVLAAAHAEDPATHEGATKILGRLLPFYYWPFMRRDIKLYVNSCPNCDPFKKFPRKKSPLGHIPESDRGDLVAIDVFGGKEALQVKTTGNKYVFVMIDVFTKYCRAIPTSNQTAETLSDRFTTEWILQIGAPHRLLSDQGTAFESALFQNMCTLWRINKIRTTPYHPPGN
jgi:hypothetical protein